MGKVKLEDVAKLAGVSPTTVSRVMNNRGYLSEKTIKKVKEAMDTLGYYPNEIARSLYGNKTNIIGLLFPNTSNPFFGEIVTEIEKYLSSKNYRVLICFTDFDPEKETKYLKMLLGNQVDGIIIGSHNNPSEIYQKSNTPFVAIDCYVSDKIPIVRSDNYEGGQMATEYLVKKKCKKIAFITRSSDAEIIKTELRAQGYLDTMKKYQYEPLIFGVDFHKESDYQREKINQFLDMHPDLEGAFCTSDTMSGMVYKQAKIKGRELEIVGYDGTDTFRSTCGDVSSIKQPIKEMAKTSVDVLLKAIAEESEANIKELVFPVTFLERSY